MLRLDVKNTRFFGVFSVSFGRIFSSKSLRRNVEIWQKKNGWHLSWAESTRVRTTYLPLKTGLRVWLLCQHYLELWVIADWYLYHFPGVLILSYKSNSQILKLKTKRKRFYLFVCKYSYVNCARLKFEYSIATFLQLWKS